jgi:gas vesicle protein
MVDQKSQQAGGTKKAAPDAPKSVRDQALEAGRELKDQATELAETSGEKLKEQASELTDAAKDVASQATDRLKEKVSEQRGVGAEYVGNLAETIRRAAREFDKDLPIAGKYIRKAAVQVENVSDSIRTGDFNDLVRNAQSFARRQPTAFLGMAVLAGFAAVRFLKSSPDASADSTASSRAQPHQDYRRPGHDFSN